MCDHTYILEMLLSLPHRLVRYNYLLYRTSFSVVLHIYPDTRALAVDETEVRMLQPRRSSQKHPPNRELRNRVVFGFSTSSSFGAMFDGGAFDRPSTAQDLKSMPLESSTTAHWLSKHSRTLCLESMSKARRRQLVAPRVRNTNHSILSTRTTYPPSTGR